MGVPVVFVPPLFLATGGVFSVFSVVPGDADDTATNEQGDPASCET
jgi:hypothetical protein